ncbi:hypothetical protein [Oceanobacillus sojae]|uniref:hypothetical protein n=1 Tax=Oceanobacillus sojae TaxID=582851 RepID=UPI0009887FBA|nr:hypothetical protein [Oceanobacillus sojae]MCT1903457.1 hypothetical protein [Oceanobacillus sojae]
MRKKKLLWVNICMLAGCIIIVGIGIYNGNRSTQYQMELNTGVGEAANGQTDESVELFTNSWENKLLSNNQQIYQTVDLNYHDNSQENEAAVQKDAHTVQEPEMKDKGNKKQETERESKTYSASGEESSTQITKYESNQAQTEENEQSNNYSSKRYTAGDEKKITNENSETDRYQSSKATGGKTQSEKNNSSSGSTDSDSDPAKEDTEETGKENKNPPDNKEDNVDNGGKEEEGTGESEQGNSDDPDQVEEDNEDGDQADDGEKKEDDDHDQEPEKDKNPKDNDNKNVAAAYSE